MTATQRERRAALERPYLREHRASAERGMERGRMPKTLDALLAWYAERWSAEMPDRLHRPGVWRDFGEHAEGGSALGSPALSDAFRRYLEDSPSAVDEDGYFQRPIHAALSRLVRRDQCMAKNLWMLARDGFEWRTTAARASCVPEMYAVYVREALRQLWIGTFDQILRAA